jgi:hypothetical protein
MLFIAPYSFSKSNVCQSSPEKCKTVEVAPSLNFYETEITPVVQALQAGRVNFSDTNCISSSFLESADILKTTVTGQDYYIVRNQTTINGHIFGTSYCQRTNFTNNTVAVDCAAKEINAAAPPALTLSFYIQYVLVSQNPNTYTILKCPQSSQ